MKLINMPAMAADSVNQILGPILGQYNNTACVGNTAASKMCHITAIIGTSVCDSSNLKIIAIGMTAANLPDAGMEMSGVIRSCGVLMSGDTLKCTPIIDLVQAEQKANFLSQLSLLSAQYKKVTYNGHHCQSVDGSTWPTITDSFTMAPVPTVSRDTVSNTQDSTKHTFDKECPQCMYAGVKPINMHAIHADVVNEILGPLLGQNNNTACLGNTAASDICRSTPVIGTSVCDSFNFKLTASGMTAANLPDAGIEVSVVIRRCGVLMSGDTPKCTPILDLVQAEQKAITVVCSI
ncbi:hypothetical protein DPMN_028146 [Dreissena polymorpha]|uniref:Uncharacterized protein n=2 Tax=Dreissena polymorpha TaxID=45954 RepID=A0A9D4LWP5_DREPO|nr:hypothetical protein DPMN_028146 [Dreissena polymorpha]